MSLKIDNIVTPSADQWLAVIHGMRNPLNSWMKSDSSIKRDEEGEWQLQLGDADLSLMRKLARAGSDHRKFLRMSPVWMDITAPLYWWKEEDQYKVGTVTNSCSTMHKIAEKEFEINDFSHEQLLDTGRWHLEESIHILNAWRREYQTQMGNVQKECWWQMIQLLPTSYNQKRTLFCNYEVLWSMFQARKEHKLDEWRTFCNTIKAEIPYFAEIFEIGGAEE